MQLIPSTHVWYPIILILSHAAAPTLASVCYYSANNLVIPSPNYVTPCGNPSATSGVINCCDISAHIDANSSCLSSSLCYDPYWSAYYLSSCTDITYTAPECPRYCTLAGRRVDQSEVRVVYDYQAELWRCCSTDPDGSADCSNTTNETFDAPAPMSLSVLYPKSPSKPATQTVPKLRTSDNTEALALALTSSEFTSTPTSSTLPADPELTHSTPTRSTSLADTKVIHSTKDPTSTPTSTTAPNSDGVFRNGDGLQPGALAGIVVAAVVAVWAGLGFIGYWLLRPGRRPAKSDPDPSHVVLQDLSIRPPDSTPFTNLRTSQASNSEETTTTLPPTPLPDPI
ncbi:hypothetical protein G7Y79_00006g018430 [Physcia stellaris]|nr:hypothetical protein G7Y79_00006g018430 [Physcia stellaris]